MKQSVLADPNVELWVLINKVSHSIYLARQRELNEYHVPTRQSYLLRTIVSLGSDATLSEVARMVDREAHVISRQARAMEKEGLIKRIKKTPKSNILTLEITKKGLKVAEFSCQSKILDEIFSTLSKVERQQLISNLNKLSAKINHQISLQHLNRIKPQYNSE